MTRTLGSYSLDMVMEFYASYRATIVFPMLYHSGFIRFAWQPQLDHTLVRGVRVDAREETFCRVIFGLDFITPASIGEYNHRLRIIWDPHIIRDAKNSPERPEMARWIIGYISPKSDEAPCIEGPTVIKKGLLTLEAKLC
ncbi:hypothetical protein FXO37_04679, partial [Capsicum annuum]